MLLENHGLIVAGDTAEAVAATSDRVLGRIADRLAGVAPPADSSTDPARLAAAADALRAVRPDLHVETDGAAATRWLAGTTAGRSAALGGPLTPDQIVYCRSTPLWLDEADDVYKAWDGYVRTFGFEPWVSVVAGAGVIALRETPHLARTTAAVYADAATVARNAARLGGVRPLAGPHRRFIETWEVEAYRRSVAAGRDRPNLTADEATAGR